MGLSLLRDSLHYLKREQYKPIMLIINGLCEHKEEPPSTDPKGDLKEVIYLYNALQIKQTPEIKEKFCKLLNGIRAQLTQ